jgi:hypothetical protein
VLSKTKFSNTTLSMAEYKEMYDREIENLKLEFKPLIKELYYKYYLQLIPLITIKKEMIQIKNEKKLYRDKITDLQRKLYHSRKIIDESEKNITNYKLEITRLKENNLVSESNDSAIKILETKIEKTELYIIHSLKYVSIYKENQDELKEKLQTLEKNNKILEDHDIYYSS